MENNPAGLDGFDFLEFATPHYEKLVNQFQSMGFIPYAKHKHYDITIFKQNEIHFIINHEPNSKARAYADIHGPCVTAMGFRTKDANVCYRHALKKGATPFTDQTAVGLALPAIYGVGSSLIYFVDYLAGAASYAQEFEYFNPLQNTFSGLGLTYIDHVTHNLYRGNMIEWANFYTKLFNFYEVRYFDIEGRMTGLKSKAMTSPCGKIRIPLNESSDDQSQIEEFLHAFNGEGIQHIALGTDDIYQSVDALHARGLAFLDTPDTYYELLEKRLPQHGEPLALLKKNRILLDGNTENERKLLLQIFTQNMLGPVFFEIIQRKGDEGFGEGNFRALFESIELDQIKRGTLKLEKEPV